MQTRVISMIVLSGALTGVCYAQESTAKNKDIVFKSEDVKSRFDELDYDYEGSSVRLLFGGFYPGGSKAVSVAGNGMRSVSLSFLPTHRTWYNLETVTLKDGTTVTIKSPLKDSPPRANVVGGMYVDYTAGSRAGGRMETLGVGMLFRTGDPFHLKTSSAKVALYTGLGFGHYQTRARTLAGVSQGKRELGGKLVAGLEARSGLIIEAAYTQAPSAVGVPGRGFALLTGWRF